MYFLQVIFQIFCQFGSEEQINCSLRLLGLPFVTVEALKSINGFSVELF